MFRAHKHPLNIALVACCWILSFSPAYAEQDDESAGVNLAVTVQGNVSVKRKSWSGYVPVVFGTMLRAGDLLRVSETSHAQIVCSDLTLQDLQVGVTGVPCVTSRAVLRKAEGSLINATRGGPKTSSFPMIL